jgi:hypothetical protein
MLVSKVNVTQEEEEGPTAMHPILLSLQLLQAFPIGPDTQGCV